MEVWKNRAPSREVPAKAASQMRFRPNSCERDDETLRTQRKTEERIFGSDEAIGKAQHHQNLMDLKHKHISHWIMSFKIF
jgi:hypothetical protein